MRRTGSRHEHLPATVAPAAKAGCDAAVAPVTVDGEEDVPHLEARGGATTERVEPGDRRPRAHRAAACILVSPAVRGVANDTRPAVRVVDRRSGGIETRPFDLD